MTTLSLPDYPQLINGYTTPHIYVVCAAAYLNGHLHGAWIEANQDPDDLQEAVNAMLATSPIPHAKEWEIHSYQNFGSLLFDEFTPLEKVSALAAFFMEDHDPALTSALLEYLDGDLEEANRVMSDCYHGEYNSEEAFTRSYMEESDPPPQRYTYYIDWEYMAKNFFISDFFSIELNGKVHVFDNV